MTNLLTNVESIENLQMQHIQNISYIVLLQKTAKKDEEEELTDDEMKEKAGRVESSSR
jgi:hypothetical protein